MGELYLKNLTFEVNNKLLCKNSSFFAKGLCCLSISNSAEMIKNISLLFTKAHLYTSNKIKLEGRLYYNHKNTHASNIVHLLNHHVIYDGKDTVYEALKLINPSQVHSLIENLEIKFYETRIDRLDSNESKIFELAVNIASNARVIFLENFNMGPPLTLKYLKKVKEFINVNNSLAIVEADYNEIFDSAIIISGNRIISFDKTNADNFHKEVRHSVFDLRPKMKRYESNTYEVRDSGPFDHRDIYKPLKTENLVDLKDGNISRFRKLITPYFYYINLGQAFTMANKKTEINFQTPDRKRLYLVSLSPLIFVIFFTRLFQIVLASVTFGNLGPLLYYSIGFLRDRKKIVDLMSYVFFTFVFRRLTPCAILTSIIKLIWGDISKIGYKFIFCSVFFSVYLTHASAFQEEQQTLRYNMLILFSPGTYICYYIIYTFLSHFSLCILFGFLFNIKGLAFSVLCATIINVMFCFCRGVRLRSSSMALFLGIYIVKNLSEFFRYKIKIVWPLFYLTYPTTIMSDYYLGCNSFKDFFFSQQFLCCCFYTLLAYIVCVNYLSDKQNQQ